jgi:glutaredoxin 3
LYRCIVVWKMRTGPPIRLYISRWCIQCERAVALLERHGLPFETVDVADPDGCCRLHELTGGRSVPQAIVDGRPIGGYDELATLIRDASFAASTTKGVAQ